MAIKDFYGILSEREPTGVKVHPSIKIRAANHSMAFDRAITHEIGDLNPESEYQLRIVDGETARYTDTYIGQLSK